MKNKQNVMKGNWVWIMIVSIIIGVCVIVFYQKREKIHIPKVCLDNQCFVVEVADTPEEWQKGLMYREFMDKNAGMIFIFPQSGIYNFWMKNTFIPLDIIWIDHQFRVVKIVTAQPCIKNPCPIYTPGTLSQYVLEVNAGIAKKYNIIEGTKMKLINIQ